MIPAHRSIVGETVAIIPARGGSRGVPRKNVRRVGGVPLVVRAVQSAVAATLIDRVLVTTDDLEIAALARDAGAEIIDRPELLASGTAGSESALLHVLDQLDDRGTRPAIVVFLQATSPDQSQAPAPPPPAPQRDSTTGFHRDRKPPKRIAVTPEHLATDREIGIPIVADAQQGTVRQRCGR